jgi:transcriptional regulator NrdR family protein
MLPCPACGNPKTAVKDSRPTDTLKPLPAIRRRRLCGRCGHRFTTREYAGDDPAEILQRVGRLHADLLEISGKTKTAAEALLRALDEAD